MGDWRSRRRRRYSTDFKREVVAAADSPGATVPVVAQRYGVNANMIFTWRRNMRPVTAPTKTAPTFLPVVLEEGEPAHPVDRSSRNRVRVHLRCGRSVDVEADAITLASLIRELAE